MLTPIQLSESLSLTICVINRIALLTQHPLQIENQSTWLWLV